MREDEYPEPPDLQEWIEAAGGYHKTDWVKWDAAVEAWHRARRIHTAGHVDEPQAAPIKHRKRR